ncbi:predicted protein [Pyrenophora tritici-repentis Pt-1C-BFP]|uniref:Uncharacterized protein n=1 Tax=Pyrenophora tritici-repentis (strain Pt-1C-BFP) TaxID=426418 RepID=B2WKV2_PYRTR|nr:uncharacterized protein PTRG_10612 [Pyrenophora tritici-repentis Pt-1C-BFP]EDU43662.1 predicted protein [Pyrenophora tritici-repentis Pt-1C-BFP]
MKITSLFTTFFFASAVMAAPGASSLKRSFRIVKNSDHPASTSVLEACAECPCDGFYGDCYCVPSGCCMNDCLATSPWVSWVPLLFAVGDVGADISAPRPPSYVRRSAAIGNALHL